MRVYDVEIELEGEKHIIPIDEDMTLLEGIEEYGKEVLYSCRAGVCITCACKLLEGEIDPGFASITDDLKAEGYVLACSAYPSNMGGLRLDNSRPSWYEGSGKGLN
ncbi:Ferredoxin [Gracilaria domingensis]|nr:Ferredoxin [Gracilaria domingensis]